MHYASIRRSILHQYLYFNHSLPPNPTCVISTNLPHNQEATYFHDHGPLTIVIGTNSSRPPLCKCTSESNTTSNKPSTHIQYPTPYPVRCLPCLSPHLTISPTSGPRKNQALPSFWTSTSTSLKASYPGCSFVPSILNFFEGNQPEGGISDV